MEQDKPGIEKKVLWIDATNGAAGDMLLGALLDAGADVDTIRAGLTKLKVESLELELAQVRRYGHRATRAIIRTSRSAAKRNIGDIKRIVREAGFTQSITAFSEEVFVRLARAEARVHGIRAEDVQFHEVGGLDAIADVVGCALALHNLGLLEECTRMVSPTAVGSGQVKCEHGLLPVPVPAVLELLTEVSAPIRGHSANMELCTPTGAAILATLATQWGPVPDCRIRAVGVGAGLADPVGHANILRVLIGEGPAATTSLHAEGLCQVETTVDDLDPRIWPGLLETLRGSGAADAWCTSVLMRKGRPGQVLTVLVAHDKLDAVCRIVFEQTTTLGIRISEVQRRELPRDQVAVTIEDNVVHVKRAYLAGQLVTIQPEFDDLLVAAERLHAPMAYVLELVRRELNKKGIAKTANEGA